MKRALIPAFLLLLGSTILGATVLREPLAQAAIPIASVFVTNDAANPVPVREQNLDADGNLKVHEQGTANVNVTNARVTVSEEPVTGGGGCELVQGGYPGTMFPTQTATALITSERSAETRLWYGADFFYEGNLVASTKTFERGMTVVVPLSRPIKFDRVQCGVWLNDFCLISWVGAQPGSRPCDQP